MVPNIIISILFELITFAVICQIKDCFREFFILWKSQFPITQKRASRPTMKPKADLLTLTLIYSGEQISTLTLPILFLIIGYNDLPLLTHDRQAMVK